MSSSESSNSKLQGNKPSLHSAPGSEQAFPSTEEPPLPASRAHGWTLGSSDNLVDGSEKESPLVSIAWIAVPTLIAVGILISMVN